MLFNPFRRFLAIFSTPLLAWSVRVFLKEETKKVKRGLFLLGMAVSTGGIAILFLSLGVASYLQTQISPAGAGNVIVGLFLLLLSLIFYLASSLF